MIHLGGGWNLHHLTDRSIELRKPDIMYRKVLGRDGFVRLRAEGGMDRQKLLHQAQEMAKRNDEELATIVSKQMIPRRIGGYRMKQQQMARVFGTPEDPEIIGVKKA